MATGETIYELEGNKVRVYQDLGSFDKEEKKAELATLIQMKQEELAALEKELADIENLQ